jgi:hypothetical protein
VTRLKEKEIYPRAEKILSIPEKEIAQCLKEAGRLVGSPWTQDQKLAALVGFVALAN